MRTAYLHSAYGLRVASPFPLRRLPRMGGLPPAGGLLRVRLTEAPLALSGQAVCAPYSFKGTDGVMVESVTGPAGDHLVRYGPDALFHLEAGGMVLRCAIEGAAWEDGLVGAVLGYVSALEGQVVLAGMATSSSGGAVALLGEAERAAAIAGRLVELGHFTFARGPLALSCRPGAVIAHPGAGAPRLARPVPLRAVVFVERAAGAGSWLGPPRDFLTQLLEAWIVPPTGIDEAERRAAGFEELVCGTPVYTLLAGDETARAADLVDKVTSRRPRPSRPPTSTSRSRTSA